MANALIAFGNTVDAGVLSGGSWRATLPLTNLQNRTLGKVARSADTTTDNTRFTLDCAASVPIRTVALVNHNLSLTAKYRIRLSNDPAFATLLADSGWLDAWPAMFNTLQLPWAAENFWSGRYAERDRQGYTWTSIFSTPFTVYARYVSVMIQDTSNSAGFVQLGRLFAGDAWQPRINMSIGAGLGWQTGTDIAEALSGAEYFAEKRPYRVAKFSLGFLSEDEAFGNAFDIKRRMGISGEVVFVFNPDDTLHALRRQFYGRLRELSLIEYPYATLNSTGFEIKELI